MLLPVADAQRSNRYAGGKDNTRKVYQMAGEGLLRSFRSFRQSATKDVPKFVHGCICPQVPFYAPFYLGQVPRIDRRVLVVE
jgi:hypothetical protein